MDCLSGMCVDHGVGSQQRPARVLEWLQRPVHEQQRKPNALPKHQHLQQRHRFVELRHRPRLFHRRGGVAYLQSPCGGSKAGGVTSKVLCSQTRLTWITWPTRWGTSTVATTPKTTAATARRRQHLSPDQRPRSWGMRAFVRPTCRATPTTIFTTTASTK